MATITIALKTSVPIGISGTLTGVPAFFFTDPAYTSIGDSAYTINLATTPWYTLKKLFDYASGGFFVITTTDMAALTAAQPVKPVTSWGSGAVHDSLWSVSVHTPVGTTAGSGIPWTTPRNPTPPTVTGSDTVEGPTQGGPIYLL
jgi:hypothetical protein